MKQGSESRRGVATLMGLTAYQWMGIIAAVVVILMLTNFFSVFTGCAGNVACLEAKGELAQFVDDVNAACSDSTLALQDDPRKLGNYDFGAAHEMVVTAPNTVYLNKYKDWDDIGYTLNDYLMGEPITGAAVDWQIKMKAEECNGVYLCGAVYNVEDCYSSEPDDGESTFIIFPVLGGTDGLFRYVTPDVRKINLKWKSS